MTLSTHLLDVARGRPVPGVAIRAELQSGDGEWVLHGAARTDADGRVATLVTGGSWQPGRWRLVADLSGTELGSFYPQVTVEFLAATAEAHHLPLLLSGHGYTTYRGS